MKYKIFGKSGLRVSEIALGTMTFGKEWGWGSDYSTSKSIFDHYTNLGGNFIDTANRYTEGTSEKFCGDFISSDRDYFVLATKYSLFEKYQNPNGSGNHRKNMKTTVENSLKRLNTDYIDLLWVHAWDFLTPVDEVMRALDDLVSSGKINYIGISDTPAWVVARSITMAELRGWNQFVGLQIEYSLIERSVEQELIPMAKELNLAVTPWAPLGGGLLTGKYLDGLKADSRMQDDNPRFTQKNLEIVKKVVEISKELEVSPGQISLKWVMQKGYNQIPIIGARKLSQLQDSMNAINLEIPTEKIFELDEISKVDLGFPQRFLNNDRIKDIVFGGTRDQIITE